MALKAKGEDLRQMLAKLRSYLIEGLDHFDIACNLGLDLGDFQELLQKFYAQEGEAVRSRSTEQVYVEYCLEQRRNIEDLTMVLSEFQNTKQHGAMVSAIKARADILDRIMARGQELGFIDKKPETKMVAGVIVGQLTDTELRRAITAELGGLDKLMSRYGDVDAPNGSILDIDPGPTHLPTPKTKALTPGTKPKQKARNRVHKGRRVVKGKAD